MEVEHLAVRDEIRRRCPFDAKRRGDRTVAIESARIGDPHAVEKAESGRTAVLLVDAHESHLVAEFSMDRLEPGHLLGAGWTP